MIIKKDKIDSMVYNTLKEEQPKVQFVEEKYPVPELVEDIYHGLYKFTPQLEEEIKSPIGKELVKNMDGNDWQSLHDMTAGNDLNALIGTTTFGEQFIDALPEELKKLDELEREKENQDKIKQQLSDEGELVPDELDKMSQETQDKIDGMLKQISDKGTDIAQAVRIAIKKATKKSNEEIKDNELQSSFYGTGDGNPMTLKEKVELRNRLKDNPRLKDIAKVIGRMERMYEAISRDKINKIPSEIIDVELGRCISSMLPSQKMMLINPATKALFYKQYNDEALLQYKKEDKDKLAKGPIYICEDNSGSMGGARIDWAKAISVVLSKIAVKEKRDLYVTRFSTHTSTNKYLGGSMTQEDIIKHAENFSGGGTDYEECLSEVMKNIKDTKADVIFITDDECDVSPEYLKTFLEAKEKYNFKIIGIQLSPNCSTTTLKLFADRVYHIDVNKDDDSEILKQIFSI